MGSKSEKSNMNYTKFDNASKIIFHVRDLKDLLFVSN